MNSIKLCKADCECLGELRETFSSKLGRDLSPKEIIELCAKILADKAKNEGIESVLNKFDI